ncbi:MAG: hypothetical protein WCV81_01205 [Microgenomates group bacterium]|jgi:hypothetical protein
MAINNPPKYRYPLFDQWDKDTFALIKEIAKTKNYPKIIGTSGDRNQFLTTMIRSQKALHDWRKLLEDTIEQIKLNSTIDTSVLNDKYPPTNIGKDTPDWVTYEEDRIVSNFIDQLGERKISFEGTAEEISEFVLRFILGQLGNDWEQTIMMIWEMLGTERSISLKELNNELKNFDYLKIFANSDLSKKGELLIK